MPPIVGAAFRLEGPPENGNAAPTGNRDGADHRKENSKLGASTSNRYEATAASSTGSKPGPRKKRQKQTVDDRFVDETPKQQAQHRAIARRYSWDDRDKPDRRRPNAQLNRRMREQERLFDDRWGPTLPDDDSGRDDLFVAAHHLAQFGDPHRHIPAWACMRAPWLSDAECTALIDQVIRKPRKWRAKALGRKMRLTQEERKRLKIRTFRAFDVSDDDMKANRAASHADGERARRRAAGAVDRAEYEAASAARNEPWKALGMTRRTWYRRGKPMPPNMPMPDGTGPCAAEYKILLGTQLCHEHSGIAPGVDASGPAFETGIVLDGREAQAPPAATKTVIDRPTPKKTVIDRKEGDCVFYLEGTGTDVLSRPCPCHDADRGRS